MLPGVLTFRIITTFEVELPDSGSGGVYGKDTLFCIVLTLILAIDIYIYIYIYIQDFNGLLRCAIKSWSYDTVGKIHDCRPI